jgi:hypothetical protein
MKAIKKNPKGKSKINITRFIEFELENSTVIEAFETYADIRKVARFFKL